MPRQARIDAPGALRHIIMRGIDRTVIFNPVPIPAALWLLGTGLVGLIGLRRKLQK